MVEHKKTSQWKCILMRFGSKFHHVNTIICFLINIVQIVAVCSTSKFIKTLHSNSSLAALPPDMNCENISGFDPKRRCEGNIERKPRKHALGIILWARELTQNTTRQIIYYIAWCVYIDHILHSTLSVHRSNKSHFRIGVFHLRYRDLDIETPLADIHLADSITM